MKMTKLQKRFDFLGTACGGYPASPCSAGPGLFAGAFLARDRAKTGGRMSIQICITLFTDSGATNRTSADLR